jgi:hypothetical protein
MARSGIVFMAEYGAAFVGIDVSQARNAIAIADEGRQAIRCLGEISNTIDVMRKLVRKLTDKHR